MIRVIRSPVRVGVAFVAMAAAHLGCTPAGGEDHRFVIGESIHVGPDETIDGATCVACSIHVDGSVKGTASLFLGSLVNRGTIERDAYVVGGSLESSGEVRGHAMLVAGNLRLGGDVGGNAVTVLGSLVVGDPNVRIGGHALTVAGEQTGIDPTRVGGSVEHYGDERTGRLILAGLLGALVLAAIGIFVVLMALNGLAYIILGAKRLEVMAEALAGNAPTCFVVGLGTSFAIAVVGVVVAMLLPVSIPMLLAFLTVSVVGYCGLSFGIGRNLFSRLKPLAAVQLAAAIIVLVQIIPVVGWLVMVVLWNIAIGIVVMSGFGTSPDWLTTRAEKELF